MENLRAIQSDKVLDRNLFIRIGDLINIDGPLLTIFQDQKDARLYLYDLMDGDDRLNRWIVYEVTPENVLDYLRKQITHLELFSQAKDGVYYYADIDPCNFNSYTINRLEHLPLKYSQTENNLFDEEYSKDAEKILLFASRLRATKENANLYNWNRDIALPARTAVIDHNAFVMIAMQANLDQALVNPGILEKLDLTAARVGHLDVNDIHDEVSKARIGVANKSLARDLNRNKLDKSSLVNAFDSQT